jgi:hypothetical protein
MHSTFEAGEECCSGIRNISPALPQDVQKFVIMSREFGFAEEKLMFLRALKVKLSLCLTKHHDMKTYGVVEV